MPATALHLASQVPRVPGGGEGATSATGGGYQCLGVPKGVGGEGAKDGGRGRVPVPGGRCHGGGWSESLCDALQYDLLRGICCVVANDVRRSDGSEGAVVVAVCVVVTLVFVWLVMLMMVLVILLELSCPRQTTAHFTSQYLQVPQPQPPVPPGTPATTPGES